MLAPLSWLKEYIDIKTDPKALGEKLTEIGLGTEKITKVDNDILFEFEITPNRPDLLSIIGVAREIAAVEGKDIKFPKLMSLEKIQTSKNLPLAIKTDFETNPRFTSIIIDGISVQESPSWLKERLIKIDQRPINNIVDITNYVMFELGNPIHAFDYHRIKDHIMKVERARGAEEFKSVNGITYHLPKDAVVIKDSQNIIDLCGIKGGYNSGTFGSTKTIVLRVPVENPILIRKASQALGLRSEASSIFERGVNTGGTLDALTRAVYLILDIAGGEIASNVFDIKEKEFKPWNLKLRLPRLQKILGIEIPTAKVLEILGHLNLSPEKASKDVIITTIPTYRNDLQIEEDLIEEVARLYGYNNFPKSLPTGNIPTQQIPYFKDYRIDQQVKQTLRGCGFSEVYTYSLVGEKDLENEKINPQHSLRVDNPVSRDFEFLRPSLAINLKKAVLQNLNISPSVNLFEIGKVYQGKTLDNFSEDYHLGLISNTKSYREMIGIYEFLLSSLGIEQSQTRKEIVKLTEESILVEINYTELMSKINKEKKYKPIPKYPPIIEDLTIIVSNSIKIGEVIDSIKKQSQLIVDVNLLDQFENTRTFRIIYQHRDKNLTNEEVSKIREKITKTLKDKFKVFLKT